MKHTYSLFPLLFLMVNLCAGAAAVAQDVTPSSVPIAETGITAYAFSILGAPKYANDFTHFDYVSPNAPKGGTLRLGVLGYYDNFNPFAHTGIPEKHAGALYETLFTMSEDEMGSYYPLIALKASHAPDYKWAVITLNPLAHFHDGKPITARDVVFSFKKFLAEGIPQYRTYYQGIRLTVITPRKVKIELAMGNREKLIGLLSSLKILPQHFWSHYNLSEPLPFPPPGSGPHRLKNYSLGQYAIYERVSDYWGAALPVNIGQYNFDRVVYEYYLDDNVALAAFKAGHYDVREETQPKQWFTQYTGRQFDLGFIKKQRRRINIPPNSYWLAFNLTRPQFSDRRVRQAISLAFDFDWLNSAFYYNSYQRPRSFFENTVYAAKALPTLEERALLEPFKDQLPQPVFDTPFRLPISEKTGFNRQNLLAANTLLNQAGWIIKNKQRVHQQTGQPLRFELVTPAGSNAQYLLPFQQQLQRLGITMIITFADQSQIAARLRQRDYDMTPTRYYAYPFPSSTLKMMWGSDYLHSSWNVSGLHSRAIDSLLNQIAEQQDNEMALLSLGRALDRLLTHEYAMIPMWFPKYTFFAYWNKLGMPAKKPRYTMGRNSWWYDDDKAKLLPLAND